MTVEEDNQTNITDDLYEKDIVISELHSKLTDMERRMHYIRAIVSAAQVEYRPTKRLYKKLTDGYNLLTSTMDWLSDLMFYLGDESEDVEDMSLESYKRLTLADHTMIVEEMIDLEAVAEEVVNIRIGLMRLLDEYNDIIQGAKPCMSIYENLIESVRGAVKQFKEINK